MGWGLWEQETKVLRLQSNLALTQCGQTQKRRGLQRAPPTCPCQSSWSHALPCDPSTHIPASSSCSTVPPRNMAAEVPGAMASSRMPARKIVALPKQTRVTKWWAQSVALRTPTDLVLTHPSQSKRSRSADGHRKGHSDRTRCPAPLTRHQGGFLRAPS